MTIELTKKEFQNYDGTLYASKYEIDGAYEYDTIYAYTTKQELIEAMLIKNDCIKVKKGKWKRIY